MQGVIMAGGKGTRLSAVTKDIIPKPMAEICGVPLIEHAIRCLQKNGITDITVIVGYLGEVIEDYVKDGTRFGVSVRYIREEQPLGTAGALFYLKNIIREDFVLVYADVLMDIDFRKMHRYFQEKNALAALLVHPNSHPYDSDLVKLNADGRITGFDYKGTVRAYDYDNVVNAGAFILSPEILGRIHEPKKTDFEKEILTEMVRRGDAVYAYASTEYIRDVGTPERFEKAAADYQSGMVKSRNLAEKQKCVFLDRDGTINQYNGLISRKEQIELLPNAVEAIRLLNASEYITVVITNQPVIARGMCTEEELAGIHDRLKTLLGNEGAFVDAIYHCPHHPDGGYPGEVAELKMECRCRKPKTGLIDDCIQRYHIDAAKSWMIGDTYRDVKTGNNAGLKSILVKSGMLEEMNAFGAKADYECEDLLAAVKLILKGV